MKVLVFDLDNTLIIWKKEYIKYLENVLKKHVEKYNDELLNKVDAAFDNYEKHYKKATYESFLEYINNTCSLNLSMEFVYDIINEQKNCYEYNQKLISVIEQLSKEYELYVLSNWFYEVQKGRLENAGIYKYFKDIYCSDNNYTKPNIESYKVLLENHNINDIIMIGDNLENDVLVPKSIGLKTIWVTDKKSDELLTIDSVLNLTDDFINKNFN